MARSRREVQIAEDKKIVKQVEKWLQDDLTWREMGDRLGVTAAAVLCRYKRAVLRLSEIVPPRRKKAAGR